VYLKQMDYPNMNTVIIWIVPAEIPYIRALVARMGFEPTTNGL